MNDDGAPEVPNDWDDEGDEIAPTMRAQAAKLLEEADRLLRLLKAEARAQ